MPQSPFQILEPTFFALNLFCVHPNLLESDYISWRQKLLILFFAVLPTYSTINEIVMYYSDYQDITAFLLVLGSIVQWVYYNVALISPVFNSTATVKFFHIIEEAQETISSLGVHQPPLPSKMTQIFYMIVFWMLPALTVFVWLTYSFVYFIVIFLLMITVCYTTLIKIKMMLLLLNTKFEVLNSRFKEMSDEAMGITSKADFDVDHFLSKLHNIKYVKPKTSGTRITVDHILKFNKAHFQLCDAHKVLDSIFSLTALISTLFAGFLLIRAFTANLSFNQLGVIQLYFTSFIFLFLFISVLSSATDVKNNCQKTGYLVHELLNEDLPLEVEEELQLFSRTLSLRKIGLSAQGFFIIDLKLLTKMVCTLAPLILILVQRKNRAAKA